MPAQKGYKSDYAGQKERRVQKNAAVGAKEQAPEPLEEGVREAFAAVKVIAGLKWAGKAHIVVGHQQQARHEERRRKRN